MMELVVPALEAMVWEELALEGLGLEEQVVLVDLVVLVVQVERVGLVVLEELAVREPQMPKLGRT